MSADQEAEFKADIRERGIRVPIELIDGGIIVDGRSRYLAAKALGIHKLPCINAPINGDHPTIYMLRAATKRRHLTDDQRACLAREELGILSAVAKRERARLGGKSGGRARANKENSLQIAAIHKPSPSSTSRSVAAKTYQVSERRVRAAQRLNELSPKLYEKVRSGEARLAAAKREADRELKRKEQRRTLSLAAETRQGNQWQIKCGDCVAELNDLHSVQVSHFCGFSFFLRARGSQFSTRGSG